MDAPEPVILLSWQLDEIAYMPLGAHCLAAVLRERKELGLAPHVLVLRPGMSHAEIRAQLGPRRPAAVLATLLPWHRKAQQLALSEAARMWPGVPILLGGPEVANRGEAVLDVYPEAYCAVAGPGETVVAELMGVVLEGRALPRFLEVPADAGQEAGDPLRGLEELQPGMVVCYETARGCPMQCAYCRWPTGLNATGLGAEPATPGADYP